MRCRNFKPLVRGTLLGFADLELPQGFTIRDCTVHEKNGSRWVGPPGKPMVDASKALVIRDGKVQYSSVIEFADKRTQRRWSDEALMAIDRYLQSKTAAGGGRDEESTLGIRNGGGK